MSQTCTFIKAWIGKCGEPSGSKSPDRCQKHEDVFCSSCGSPATHQCDETGQFVCGAPLCDECEHLTYPDGTNGGVGFNQQRPPEGLKVHVKKSQQVYQPWYARTDHA